MVLGSVVFAAKVIYCVIYRKCSQVADYLTVVQENLRTRFICLSREKKMTEQSMAEQSAEHFTYFMAK